MSIATQNSNRGISIIETADGALTEVHDMLQRMNELAVKGATGTLTSIDRETLNQELKQLKEEVTRISTADDSLLSDSCSLLSEAFSELFACIAAEL